ncbi:MAG: lipase maturation factor family protein [Planctomycetes bacterium]|nr:lipase maturation factor family protein [Planctomycetota bacterium]
MPSSYAIASWIYLRTLGWCAVAAFGAMYTQALGLVGSAGLTPVAATMQRYAAECGGANWLRVPTVFWWSSGDAMVHAVFVTGIAAGVLLLLGLVPRVAAIVGFGVVLSIRSTEPLGLRWFNWPFDDLLAESLFVAIWLAPNVLWSRPHRPEAPRPWARWLVLWLLFRLILGTGVTKLLSGGDWHSLTAIQPFLLTQPFPTAFGAALHAGPAIVAQATCLYTMAWELLAPWFFFWRGRPARIAGLAGVPLMVGIWATGSFRGFNHLTIAMLLLTIDDATWRRWLPTRLMQRIAAPAPIPPGWPGRALAAAVLGLVAVASFEPLGLQAGGTYESLPAPSVRAAVRPFHLAANYWVFSTVATQRLQLVVQGSDDGTTWRDYQPLALPAAVDQPFTRIAPGNDHLGFLMWLSAWGGPELAVGWEPRLLQGLLAGEPTIRALFRHDPFPDAPPRHVRVSRWLYAFASPEERTRGIYWQRQLVDVHLAAQR